MLLIQRLRRPFVVLVLLLPLGSCHHYVTPQGITPAEYLSSEQPQRARVTLTDGTRQVLWNVRLARDSIYGFLAEDQAVSPGAEPQWKAPLAMVQRLEIYEANSVATFGLVTGIVVVVGALAVGTAAILILTSME